MRLPTELWVKAHSARCSAEGMPMVVVRRGDPHRGVVIVKLVEAEGRFRIRTQTRELDGGLVWSSALDDRPVPEAEADAFIARQAGYDPDLWVIEVDARVAQGWFHGPVE